MLKFFLFSFIIPVQWAAVCYRRMYTSKIGATLYLSVIRKFCTSDFLPRFICLPCAGGCDECIDNSPCFLEPNAVLRFTLAVLQCIFIIALLGLGIYTFVIKDNNVNHSLQLWLIKFGEVGQITQIKIN